MRPGAAIDRLRRELRQAARRLVRAPAFTLATVLTLALAIAANVSIFAVVQRVVLNPLGYPDPDRLIAIDLGWPSRNIPSGLNSIPSRLFFQYADHARTLDGVAVYRTEDLTLTGSGSRVPRPRSRRYCESRRRWAVGSRAAKVSQAPHKWPCCLTGCGSEGMVKIRRSSAVL
jgi:hypothetical protein